MGQHLLHTNTIHIFAVGQLFLSTGSKWASETNPADGAVVKRNLYNIVTVLYCCIVLNMKDNNCTISIRSTRREIIETKT